MSFSQKHFRQSLLESSKIAVKFEKYLSECKKSNIEVVYHMVEEFLRILNDKETLLLKVNALFALNLCLHTCEYAIVELVEAFLLPALQEVALYQADKRNYAKTSQFFKDRGYPQSTPNIEQLSHNYVTMATNLAFLGAAVKDSYYFFTDKLNLPSAYKQLANKILQKGNEIPPAVADQAADLQQQYESNLYQFENHEAAYVEFFKRRMSSFLMEGGRSRESLDIRKILKNNDSWLTSEIIGSLHDALQDQNFQVRRNSLTLLNELFLWGDVEAIMVVNEGDAVERICERILQVKGPLDLGRGAYIYPELKGQADLKKNFYVDFLRCVELWAKLVPSAIYLNRDEDTKALRFYSNLKDKNIVFPNADMMGKQAKEFQENMRRNKQRNNYIITQLNDGDTSKNKSVASHRLSKYSQKISLIKEMRESTILTLSEIERLVEDAEVALKVLPKSEREVSKHMKTLKHFAEEFDKKFGLIEESVTEQHLEALYQRGSRCVQKTQQIEPLYSDYLNGKIDFKKFGEMLQAKFSQINNSKFKSKFSDILSKLSKSKHSFSKDGLELSKSLQNMKGKEYNKQDLVLEKSVEDKSKSVHNTQNNLNRTNNNPSNLSEKQDQTSKLSKTNKKEVQAEKQEDYTPQKFISQKTEKSKHESRLSKGDSNKNSMSFSQQQSIRSSDKDKIQTAKFLRDSDEAKKSPRESSSRANHYSQNTPDYKRPQTKQREEFQGNSDFSSSQEQAPKPVNKPTSKVEKPNLSQQQQTIKNKTSSKSREVFSDSSFSQYDASNEEIREAIDKNQNPDFKMLFKDKTFSNNPSQYSKMSKLQSHEHYAAVLESLVPKSSQNQAQKSLSKLSKDKSTSQLPPKSNFDQESKIENQKIYNLPEEYEYSKEDSSSVREKIPNKGSANKSNSMSSGHHDSKTSNSKLAQGESNSMNPPEKQKSSISKSSRQAISPHSSIMNQDYQNHVPRQENPSKISEASSQGKSKLSRYNSEEAFKKKISQKSGLQLKAEKRSESKLQSVKVNKLNEIKELQKRIESLKKEEKQFYSLRSDWQSPTRPNTIRTALSPRFRNHNQSNPSNQTERTDCISYTQQQFRKSPRNMQRQRTEEMNFDMTELFKPPQGRLIYTRLYNKQLSQLNIRERRKILKGKDLVFRNEDIQIGMMVHRDMKDLKIIYYVTASRYIKTFLFKIEASAKLAVHAIPNQISNLEPRKQYRIYFFGEVLEFPYKMPQIQFKYHPELLDIQQKLFITNEINYFTSIVPFFFTKFLTMRQTTLEQIQKAWTGGVLRGEEIAYSKKILPKHFYILQYFPDMINIESREYQNWYGVQCEYGSTKFLLKVVIKINKFLYIQGAVTSFRDRANSERIMQYTICCINQLLSKTHKDPI